MPPNGVSASKYGDLSFNRRSALLELRSSPTSIRKCAKRHNIPYSTLQRLHRRQDNATSPKTRGRQPLFTITEEGLIMESILSFSHCGTPLSRDCFKDILQHFVRSLPHQRRSTLPFQNDRPGDGFVRNFLRRHPQVSIRRRSNLEKPRQLAMCPTNLAKHYARLIQVYKEYKITCASQIFNIDESGFSTRTASRSRAKALFDSRGRSNSVELKWTANAQHVTIMPVVSADGRAWSPLAVLPGKHAKYRRRQDGSVETPSTFLPPTAHCVYREKAGVDSEIFYQWGQKFVIETSTLREKYRRIVLILDGYGAHCTFKVLQLFKENGIVVVGLPAHTSHRTQPLDFSVFSSYKTAFRNDLNRRTLLVKDEAKNDVYTICELLTLAYNKALTFQNITSGFRACGLWSSVHGGFNPNVITATDITNLESAWSQQKAFANYKQLVMSFKDSCNLLRSDGDVLVNGTLNNTSGLLLTEERVLTDLAKRESERRDAEKARQQRAPQVELRRLQKKREEDKRQRQRLETERGKAIHLLWLSCRPNRAFSLASSRASRQRAARLRTAERNQDTRDTH